MRRISFCGSASNSDLPASPGPGRVVGHSDTGIASDFWALLPLGRRRRANRSTLRQEGFTASGGTACRLQYGTLVYNAGVICDTVANFRMGDHLDATLRKCSA